MRALLVAGMIAVLGLAMMAGPATAQPTPPIPTFNPVNPIPGVDNFAKLNDAETASVAGDLVAQIRDAIARCDRPAWQEALQKLRNLASTIGLQAALVRASLLGSPAGTFDLLFRLLFDQAVIDLLAQTATLPELPDSFGLRYPDPCERRVGVLDTPGK